VERGGILSAVRDEGDDGVLPLRSDGPVMARVICPSCATYQIPDELRFDVEAGKVQSDRLALVAGASRRAAKAGGSLTIMSLQELLTFASDEERLQAAGW